MFVGGSSICGGGILPLFDDSLIGDYSSIAQTIARDIALVKCPDHGKKVK
jgi:hypothetical protein